MDILDELSKHLPDDLKEKIENMSDEDKEELVDAVNEDMLEADQYINAEGGIDDMYPHVIEPYVGNMMNQLMAQSGPVRKKAPAKNKKAKNKLAKASRKKNRKK